MRLTTRASFARLAASSPISQAIKAKTSRTVTRNSDRNPQLRIGISRLAAPSRSDLSDLRRRDNVLHEEGLPLRHTYAERNLLAVG